MSSHQHSMQSHIDIPLAAVRLRSSPPWPLTAHSSAKHDFTFADGDSITTVASHDKPERDLLMLAVNTNALSRGRSIRSPFDDITSQNPSASVSQTERLNKRWPPVPPEKYGSAMAKFATLLPAQLKDLSPGRL